VGDYAALSNELLFMTEDQFTQTLPSLSPAAYHAVTAASRRTTQDIADGLAEHLRTRRAVLRDRCRCGSPCAQSSVIPPSAVDPSSEPLVIRPQNCDAELNVFARPFGTFHSEKATENRVGFASNGPGVQLLFDRERL
jgi:hypothetical protein